MPSVDLGQLLALGCLELLQVVNVLSVSGRLVVCQRRERLVMRIVLSNTLIDHLLLSLKKLSVKLSNRVLMINVRLSGSRYQCIYEVLLVVDFFHAVKLDRFIRAL